MEIKEDLEDGSNICAICCDRFSKQKVDFSSSFHYRILCEQFTSGESLPGYHEGTLLICLNCLASVSSILGKRDQVTRGELEVRKLQVKLLKVLRSLQSRIDSFKEEMGRVERMVEDGRDKIKELDDFYAEMESGQVGATLKDAIQFRKKILTVFEDLCAFRNDIIVVKDQTDLTSASVRKSTKVSNTLSEKVPQDNRNDKQIPPVPPPASPDDDDRWEDDDGPEEEISNQGSDKGKGPCSEEHGVGDDDKQSSGSESDPEFIPASLKVKKKKQNKRLAPSILPSLDFTGMSTFKKNFITRVVLKFEKHQNAKHPPKHGNRKYPDFDDIDPLKTHFIQYDPATDSVKVSDIEITVNEPEETLHCSQCDFQTSKHLKDPAGPDKSIFTHILGQHLNLFTCPCCATRLNSHQRFRDHFLSHNNHFDCDICGKSLKAKDILRRHKWSHMNEEERAEAIKNGEKPPERNSEKMERMRKMGKKFQCSICGKAFNLKCVLQEHELTHEKERKHMCTQCGKAFKLRSALMSHLKYVCFPEKGKVPRDALFRFQFQCDICLMKFPLASRLKKHKLVHTELPYNFKCSICEKAFKSQQNLNHHVKTHSDARPHECRKGCGATYKTRTHCYRHEKSCKNAGVQ